MRAWVGGIIALFVLLGWGEVSYASYYKRSLTSGCFQDAVIQYRVHPDLLLAIQKVEGGDLGLVMKNTDGSYDLGRWQINTIHLKELGVYGLQWWHLAWDDCVNVMVAAWHLRRCLDRYPRDFWRGVGCYHSKTPSLNRHYQQRVAKALVAIRQGKQ